MTLARISLPTKSKGESGYMIGEILLTCNEVTPVTICNPVVPRNNICCYPLIRMSHMSRTISVVDSSSNVERFRSCSICRGYVGLACSVGDLGLVLEGPAVEALGGEG